MHHAPSPARRSLNLVVAVLAALVAAGDSVAQDAPAASAPLQALVSQNRAAMEAYAQLDLDRARGLLETALQQAETAGVTGAPVARTRMNLGVVFAGGLGDNARGVEQFQRAIQIDPGVELDPVTSTPEIIALFRLARQTARPATPIVQQPPPQPPTPAMSLIRHAPAREQLAETPVPVFLEVAPFVRVARVDLFYRGRGMNRYERVSMRHLGSGWATYIPCMASFEPRVDYYVLVQDEGRRTIASAGTPQQPISVPIVRRRNGAAASLPRLPAPEECSDDNECPPGFEGCQSGPTCGNRRCEGSETETCELDCYGRATSRSDS